MCADRKPPLVSRSGEKGSEHRMMKRPSMVVVAAEDLQTSQNLPSHSTGKEPQQTAEREGFIVELGYWKVEQNGGRRYQKAIEIYEAIARQSIDNNLLKYGVSGYLVNAALCQLCKGDVISINNALERYEDLDPTFSRTREYRFLAVKWCLLGHENFIFFFTRDLAAAIDEQDVEKFMGIIREFDSITRLDPWKTTLLLRAKDALKAKELEQEDLT
ncbi:Alpha-soluble NSF attachment protein [Morella rubra]|uniref:Alpha-soluble NSF attachment protein n=1 Tax=Morella rubra TaxID=262757 RepID=A0A6A1WL08_9ROSI|nr:Alpha-soluble NSF attachment protein [Morella rubra]